MPARKTDLTLPLPPQLLAAWLAVWLGRVLQEQVDYLRAENRLLREKLGTKRIRLTDTERRRLASLGKPLGRKGLAVVATIASPVTILRWYEAHLRCAILEYTKHYHDERNHQGLDNELIVPAKAANCRVGKVERRERLGGLLSFYYRKAA